MYGFNEYNFEVHSILWKPFSRALPGNYQYDTVRYMTAWFKSHTAQLQTTAAIEQILLVDQVRFTFVGYCVVYHP